MSAPSKFINTDLPFTGDKTGAVGIDCFMVRGPALETVVFGRNKALLHKSAVDRMSPFPGQTYPVTSVMGVPSAVKPLSTATLTWNSAT